MDYSSFWNEKSGMDLLRSSKKQEKRRRRMVNMMMIGHVFNKIIFKFEHMLNVTF